jgi:hypothetical protein
LTNVGALAAFAALSLAPVLYKHAVYGRQPTAAAVAENGDDDKKKSI